MSASTRDDGRIRALIQQVGSGDPKAQYAAAVDLSVLATDPSSQVRLVELDAIPVLIRALDHNSRAVQELSSVTLACLVGSVEPSSDQVVSCGAIPKLVRLLGSPSSSPQCLEHVLVILGGLSGVSGAKRSTQRKILAAGAVPKVLQALRHSEEGVRTAAAYALARMCDDNALVAAKVVDCGGADVLVECLDLEDPTLLENVCLTLSSLGTGNTSLQSTLVQRGALSHLQRLLGRGHFALTVAVVYTIAVLSECGSAAREIERLGLIPPLLALLDVDDAPLLTNTLLAIGHIADTVDASALGDDVDGIVARVAHLQTSADDETVAAAAAQALGPLGRMQQRAPYPPDNRSNVSVDAQPTANSTPPRKRGGFFRALLDTVKGGGSSKKAGAYVQAATAHGFVATTRDEAAELVRALRSPQASEVASALDRVEQILGRGSDGDHELLAEIGIAAPLIALTRTAHSRNQIRAAQLVARSVSENGTGPIADSLLNALFASTASTAEDGENGESQLGRSTHQESGKNGGGGGRNTQLLLHDVLDQVPDVTMVVAERALQLVCVASDDADTAAVGAFVAAQCAARNAAVAELAADAEVCGALATLLRSEAKAHAEAALLAVVTLAEQSLSTEGDGRLCEMMIQFGFTGLILEHVRRRAAPNMAVVAMYALTILVRANASAVRQLRAANGLVTLSNILHETDVDALQTYTIHALCACAALDRAARTSLSRESAVLQRLHVLSTSARAEPTRDLATRAFAALSSAHPIPDTLLQRLGAQRRRVEAWLMPSAALLPAVIYALDASPSDGAPLCAAMAVLFMSRRDRGLAARFVDAEEGDALAALDVHLRTDASRTLLTAAAMALATLVAYHPHRRRALADRGVLRRLSHLVAHSDLGVRIAALFLVAAVCRDDPEMAREAVALGMTPRLYAAVDHTDPAVQANAALALSFIAVHSANARSQLRDAGAVAVLDRLARLGPDERVKRYARAALDAVFIEDMDVPSSSKTQVSSGAAEVVRKAPERPVAEKPASVGAIVSKAAAVESGRRGGDSVSALVDQRNRALEERDALADELAQIKVDHRTVVEEVERKSRDLLAAKDLEWQELAEQLRSELRNATRAVHHSEAMRVLEGATDTETRLQRSAGALHDRMFGPNNGGDGKTGTDSSAAKLPEKAKNKTSVPPAAADDETGEEKEDATAVDGQKSEEDEYARKLSNYYYDKFAEMKVELERVGTELEKRNTELRSAREEVQKLRAASRDNLVVLQQRKIRDLQTQLEDSRAALAEERERNRRLTEAK